MNDQIKRPMLAETIDRPERLDWRDGYLCSPKLDGVRCIAQNGQLLSRSMKPIRNRSICQSKLANLASFGLDGELIVYDQNDRPLPFNDIQSAVMSADVDLSMREDNIGPRFRLNVFDRFDGGLQMPFRDRLERIMQASELEPEVEWCVVPHRLIRSPEELATYEEEQLARGHEGVMLRRPDGPYKQGRSTLREAWLLKLKRFRDDEAEVIGFEELLVNRNEPTRNRLGLTERSGHQANLVPAGTLGALLVRDLKTGIEFSIGTGFDQKTRQALWDGRVGLVGQIVNYQHFTRGAKEKPRFPSFRGFRDRDDF